MSAPRFPLVIVVIAALIVLGLVGLLVREESPARAGNSSLGDSPGSAATLESELASTRDVSADFAHAARAPLAATTPSGSDRVAMDPDGLRLVVVESGEHKLLPGAHAWVWTPPTNTIGIARDAEDWLGPDAERAIVERGREIVADANAEIDLPPAQDRRFLVARSGELYGFIELHPALRGLLELELSPQHDLLVRVVDARGVPQPGTPVGLGICGDSAVFWDSPTNAKGEVRCRNLDALGAMLGLERTQPLAVRLATPADPPVEEWITLDRLGSDPLVLTLPPSGSLRVTIVDAAHRRVPIGGVLRIASSGVAVVARARVPDAGGMAPIENGIARFAHVGLNLDLVLSADLLGTGDNEVSIKGPTSPGEDVAIEIPMPEDHTLLTGRVIDESGRPVTHTAFDWRRIVDDGARIVASGRNTLTTDGDGRFLWTLRRGTRIENAIGTLKRRGFLCEVSEGALRRQAVIEFPTDIRSAGYEMGDLRVLPLGPLVSGRVLDDRGEGLGAVTVEMREHAHDGSYDSAETFDPSVSTADGSFAIFGPPLPIPLALVASSDDHGSSGPVPFECKAGGVHVDIRMTAMGRIVGTALVDHDWSGAGLVIHFAPAAAASDADSNLIYADYSRAGDRVFFAIGPIRAGRGRVEFRVEENATDPFASFDDVVVTGGTRTRDSRLQDVDMRGKLPKKGQADAVPNAIEIEIVDVRGRPVKGGFAWLWSDARDDFKEILWAGGRVRVEVGESRSIEIWSPLMRSKFVHPPHRSSRVALAPELEVQVKIDVPDALRDARFKFFGTVALLEDEQHKVELVPASLQRLSGFQLDAEGRAELRLPTAGAFQIDVSLSGMAANHEEYDGYGLSLVSPTLDVREIDGEQRFHLHFEPEALQQCLVDLGFAPAPR